jgi:UDP-N-acetylmuramyl pentapeptide phosphotransferase/UDP-N-acetylglucosamine-1-phosphate transferase
VTILAICLLALALSCCLAYGLWRFPLQSLLDNASDRSLHTGVVPRSGGIAILLAFMVTYALSGISILQPLLLLSLTLLCVISLWDDIVSLSPAWRLLVQLLAAAILVFGGQLYVSVFDGLPLVCSRWITLLGLVWMINLYNFMDGMDGFASGMAIFGFGSLALLGYLHGDTDYAIMNALLVAAVAGFWCWNFPPARIFMGDTGAVLLGALAGILAVLGVQRELFPLWVPAILFSAFWVDATYTLLRRMVRGEKFWQPHRSHFYQRLVSSGLGHRPVVLGEYLLMLACSLTVCLPPLLGLDYNGLPPLVWGLLYPVLILALEQKLKK